MPNTCCVEGCLTGLKSTNSENPNPKNQTFGFPENPDLRKLWLLSVRKDESTIKISHRVCIEHFRPEDFIPDELNLDNHKRRKVKKSLRVNAVPSINLGRTRLSVCPKPKQNTVVSSPKNVISHAISSPQNIISHAIPSSQNVISHAISSPQNGVLKLIIQKPDLDRLIGQVCHQILQAMNWPIGGAVLYICSF